MVLALDRRRHRPADRMRILGGQVAGDREHVGLGAVVHDRQLPALAHVARVRQALAHHVHELHAAVHVQPLVAIRRETHVARTQRHALRDRHSFLAECFHVKGDAALALDLPHALVEYAVEHHPAQSDLQLARIEIGRPGAYGLVFVIEDTNETGA